MLLDTSGLLCCFDASDPRHQSAVALYRAAALKLVHSYVLAELAPLCESRGLSRRATLAYLTDLVQQPDVEVVWVDALLHERAMDLLARRLDKRYSLCDAVSFVLMVERSMLEALTTDRHFDQEGLHRLLPFQG